MNVTPDSSPPNTDVLAAAAICGGLCGLAAGYYLALETENLSPDAVLYYDADAEPVWSYE